MVKGAIESYEKYEDHAVIECDHNNSLEMLIDILRFSLKQEGAGDDSLHSD